MESLEKSDLYEKITISNSMLLPKGEVPKDWLENFRDFKTWDDLKYSCRKHCGEVFKSLNALLLHQESLPARERFICCDFCDKLFGGYSAKYYVCSYINHVSKSHYEYIKFCCVLCSKVFQNMPYLVKHYQENHADEDLTMFPCLECGLYCQSVFHLKSHFKSHKKAVKDKFSDVE